MVFIIKALLISLVMGSPLTSQSSQDNNVALCGHSSSSLNSSNFCFAQSIQFEMRKIQVFKRFETSKQKQLSSQLSYDFKAGRIEQTKIESIIRGTGITFEALKPALFRLSKELRIKASSIKIISSNGNNSRFSGNKIKSINIYSNPQKVSELIKLTSLRKSLSSYQVSLLADYFSRAIQTKTVNFDGIITFCQERNIPISTKINGFMTFLKEINQLTPEVVINLEGYYKYMVKQPKIYELVNAFVPRIKSKVSVDDTKIIEALCLYLDAKARAEARAEANAKYDIDFEYIIQILNIERDDSLISELRIQFNEIETHIIEIEPEIVISRTLYIPAPPVIEITEYEIREQSEYKRDLDILISKSEYMDSNRIDTIFTELDTKYSSCKVCISSSYYLKKETQIYTSAGFNSYSIREQIDISTEAKFESNYHYLQSSSLNSNSVTGVNQNKLTAPQEVFTSIPTATTGLTSDSNQVSENEVVNQVLENDVGNQVQVHGSGIPTSQDLTPTNQKEITSGEFSRLDQSTGAHDNVDSSTVTVSPFNQLAVPTDETGTSPESVNFPNTVTSSDASESSFPVIATNPASEEFNFPSVDYNPSTDKPSIPDVNVNTSNQSSLPDANVGPPANEFSFPNLNPNPTTEESRFSGTVDSSPVNESDLKDENVSPPADKFNFPSAATSSPAEESSFSNLNASSPSNKFVIPNVNVSPQITSSNIPNVNSSPYDEKSNFPAAIVSLPVNEPGFSSEPFVTPAVGTDSVTNPSTEDWSTAINNVPGFDAPISSPEVKEAFPSSPDSSNQISSSSPNLADPTFNLAGPLPDQPRPDNGNFNPSTDSNNPPNVVSNPQPSLPNTYNGAVVSSNYEFNPPQGPFV